MTFQIDALAPSAFADLFEMDDATLAARNARRVTVDASPGYPCRISLEDAQIGEDVILTNYTHQPAASAFRATHAIYVRKDVPQAIPDEGEVPEMIRTRLTSARGFNDRDEICKADVVDGTALAETLEVFFADQSVRYVHLHNAKLGCFTASARRA